jgi:dienelactone hydrolase
MALSLSLLLAVPSAEPWLAPVLSEVATEEVPVEAGGRRLVADLYRPPAPGGALLLVHGLSRAGRRHPELVRLARLLARHRRLVLVPQFESMAAFRLSGREIVEVGAAIDVLVARGAPVGVIGFSFGAGPALLAAANAPDLALSASFGGYAELGGVIGFLTTGIHSFDGRRYEQAPEEYNRWKLLALLVGFTEDARDRRRLDDIATRKLADPGADTRALESGLGSEGRAVLAIVQNRREDSVVRLLAELPAGARAAMQRLSPLAVMSRLTGRLVIAHGAGDASIPFSESLRLAQASRGRAAAVILETFEHTGPRSIWQSLASRSRDAARLVRLADALLASPGRRAARRPWPARPRGARTGRSARRSRTRRTPA